MDYLGQLAPLRGILTRLINEVVDLREKPQVAQGADTEFLSALLFSFGSALTEEEQVWLCQPCNNKELPSFLASPEGQAITRRLFSFYKQYKEQKCK